MALAEVQISFDRVLSFKGFFSTFLSSDLLLYLADSRCAETASLKISFMPL
jgi:hypothetical protein